ncbi:MAG: SRPBCC family protein [Cyanobacteria bacterium P01_D01_bin.6]
MTQDKIDPSELEIVITRVFNAPRELVFQAWTEPDHIAQWWGPKGFTTRVTELDLRPGGTWRYVMTSPEGKEYPVKGVFREIIPPERLVTTDRFDGVYEQGTDLPQEMVTTAAFEDLGNQTKLILTTTHPSVEERRKHEEMGAIGGWNSSFDRLQDYLENKMAG